VATLHVYQGLDVGIHSAIKTYWGQERNNLEEEMGKVVTKDNFVEVYSKAHVKGMTHKNILAVFKKTGLHPFNPNMVTVAMLAPSLEISTLMASVFAITQPGRVDTMLKAIQQVNMPLQCTVQGHNLQQTRPTTPQLSRTNPLTP
jgi:hypothetical protein